MKTISELIEFVEAIPEEKWCQNVFSRHTNGKYQCCIAGHLNFHVAGQVRFPIDNAEPCLSILNPLGIDRTSLVRANNYPGNLSVKRSVLNFLNREKEKKEVL